MTEPATSSPVVLPGNSTVTTEEIGSSLGPETPTEKQEIGHIRRVRFKRFKRFQDTTIDLQPGVTLLAGANNAGKSTLLHGLAVWEFCRTATLMERGVEGLVSASTGRQGFGLGDDEFSPVNVPSLKHLWTNLKTAKTPDDPDGYTLSISCEWDDGFKQQVLGFSLALANDRLFIKLSESSLQAGDGTPAVAYLPPFAGIKSREERVGGAIRRRRIGEGLAGAILRNLLLDMYQENLRRRALLKEGRKKIPDSDLRALREEDPWELLQQTLRQVFNAEIQVNDFAEEYHSYISVEVTKGAVEGYKLTRFPNFNPRDLMVEGSGFLQWLSVYTLAVTPKLNLLMFDEPDAHLHPSLQQQLLGRLEDLAARSRKQVLVATHSSEILRSADPRKILQLHSSGAKYLSEDYQKVGMLAGLGSSYAPKIDRIRDTKRILFLEGSSDLSILKELSNRLGRAWPGEWVEWLTTASQKERRSLWYALKVELGDVVAFSLRDRDDEAIATVGAELLDQVYPAHENNGFRARKWRRRYIESYLIWPPAIAECTGLSEEEVRLRLQEEHALAVGESFLGANAPTAILDMRGKEILESFGVDAIAIAKVLPSSAICADVLCVLDQLAAGAPVQA